MRIKQVIKLINKSKILSKQEKKWDDVMLKMLMWSVEDRLPLGKLGIRVQGQL